MTAKVTSQKTNPTVPRLPAAPRSIQKGSSLGDLLDREAIECLAHNIGLVFPKFDHKSFQRAAHDELKPLAILQREHHLARALRTNLPERYSDAIEILIRSISESNDRCISRSRVGATE